MPLSAVRGYISQLIAEIAKLLPFVMEPENVLKRTVTSYIYELQAYGVYRFWQWVTRVEEIKANMAVNVEAERKAAQLNDKIRGLIRSLKTKDQAIQESTVKIELMERRMETVKKQADRIVQG